MVEAGGSITFELSDRCLREDCHMCVQDLWERDILALAPWTPVLAKVKKLIIHIMMHSAAPEENADHQVEIHLKEMHYS
jgi:hypothetical protein